MPLDATPGGPNSNSYITEAAATTYLGNERLYISAWTAATTTDREKALIWATALLDFSFDWVGTPTFLDTQALRWPRGGAWTEDGKSYSDQTIPRPLEKATAELAFEIVRNAADPTKESSLLGQGFKSLTVDVISIELDVNQDVKELIPDIVILMLSELGGLKGIATQGAKVMKLSRA